MATPGERTGGPGGPAEALSGPAWGAGRREALA